MTHVPLKKSHESSFLSLDASALQA
uniref:Uncharacterized protein n=1 Tax=Rhizophora mucronata TaxID=61149 RepID=A0A2P2PRA4_RHIMU